MTRKQSGKDTKLKWKEIKIDSAWQSLEVYTTVNGKNKEVVSVCLIDEIPKVTWRNKRFHSEY